MEAKEHGDGKKAPAPATAPPAPAPAEPDRFNGWNGKLGLRREIPDGNGGMTKEIVLREPTAFDIERIGNPVIMSIYETPVKPIFDARLMTAMLATLATVPPPSIRAMHPVDWQNAAYRVMFFFMPDL